MVSEEAGERLAQQAAGPGLSHFSLALEPQLLTARHAARGALVPAGAWGQPAPKDGAGGKARARGLCRGRERSALRGGGGLGVLGAVISSTEE